MSSSDGRQADILVVEPALEECRLRCLCHNNGTTHLGEPIEPGHVQQVEDRYGPKSSSP